MRSSKMGNSDCRVIHGKEKVNSWQEIDPLEGNFVRIGPTMIIAQSDKNVTLSSFHT